MTIALLSIVAISVAASDLDATGTGRAPIEGPRGSSVAEPTVSRPSDPAALSPVVLVLTLLLALSILVASLVQRLPTRREIAALVVLVGTVALALALASNLSFGFDSSSISAVGGGLWSILPERGGPGGPSSDVTSPPMPLLGVIVLGAIVAAGVAFVSKRREASRTGTSSESIGSSSGRARLPRTVPTDEPAENGIYRAWRAMAARIDGAERRSATPGEIAVRAVDEGLCRSDVAELTHLFEYVRYGDAEPSDEREQRARNTLERMEKTDDE